MNVNIKLYKQVLLIFNSSFHTTCNCNVTARQTGKFMNKVLGNTKKKRPHYSESLPVISDVFSKSPAGSVTANPRRVTVLNKLFMRNITDLMSTEEYSSQILGLGVEIIRVKITPDFKILNVYWTAHNSNIEEAENILLKNAGLLRHELSQLRLMGNVPRIKFVKDKEYSNFIALNEKLAIADYGEDGPPNTDPAAQLICELELSLPIEDDMKEKLLKFDEQNPNETQELELPPMSQCVFNLDHADIMNRLSKRSSKNRSANNRIVDENWASFKLDQYSNKEPVIFDNAKLQREEFNKFLQQRKILKMKHDKSRDTDLEDDFIGDEYETKYVYNKDIDEDYIIEDTDDQIVK